MDYDSASSSSTKSFAWAPASNSSDSECSNSKMIVHKNKKKQKQYNEDISKLHIEDSTHHSETSIDSPQKVIIKPEENEDIYTSKKKKKNRDKCSTSVNLEENVIDDYDFLNKKVKQEEDENNKSIDLKVKSKKISENDLSITSNELDSTLNYSTNKKEKKKKNKHKNLDTDVTLSDDQKNDTSSKKRKSKCEIEIKINENNDDHFNIDVKETFVPKSHLPCKENKYSVLDDYDFLNKKVKQEVDENNKSIDLKLKRKRTCENDLNISSNELDSTLNYSSNKKEKKKNKISKNLDTDVTLFDDQNNDSSSNKRKSKCKVEINIDECNNDLNIEDKFSVKETVEQKPHYFCEENEYENIVNSIDEEVNDTEDTDSKSDNGLCKNSVICGQSNNNDLHINRKDSTNCILEKKSNHESMCESSSNNITVINKKAQSTSKILDRIRFEGDTDDDEEAENSPDKESLRLKKILIKDRPFLEPVLEKSKKYQKITDDDELWLVKCPHNLDIVGFSNKELALDSKSKIKISGETCNVNLNENIVSLTLMTPEKKEFLIKNVNVKGTVTLQKRLARPHIVEDNVMVNNQTDFIPLPETKCHHPLFGSNYKNALKLPSSITQRLQGLDSNQSLQTAQIEKKKRKKRTYAHNTEEDTDIITDIKPNIDCDIPTKKAKKRKHDNDIETTVKKAKRLKQEFNHNDWESEKAIEENLFNF